MSPLNILNYQKRSLLKCNLLAIEFLHFKYNINRHSEPRIQERLARSVIQRFTLPVVNVRSGSCSHSMTSGGIPNIRWSEARVQLRLPLPPPVQNFSEEADGRGLMFAKLLQILFQLRICMGTADTTSGGRASRT